MVLLGLGWKWEKRLKSLKRFVFIMGVNSKIMSSSADLVKCWDNKFNLFTLLLKKIKPIYISINRS